MDGLSRDGMRSNSMKRFLSVFRVQSTGAGWNDDVTVMDGEDSEEWTDPDQTDYDGPAGNENTIPYEDDDMDQGYTEPYEDDMDDGYTVADDSEDMDMTMADDSGNDTVSEHRPTLRRLSTGEKRVITGDDFKIGRSASRADFCITGNHCISNVHAIIVCIGDGYYIKDNYSTNGTYVDGEQIRAGDEPKRLSDGSVIRMWDEDFEFRL